MTTTFEAYCQRYPLPDGASREAVWRRSADYQRLVAAERRERLTRERDEACARVADVPGIDLLLTLIRYVDGDHESDTSYCHPRVPEDCSAYCRACATLREVRDDVLLAARAQARLESEAL